MTFRNLGFRDLQYIIAIADHGSFGRAAQACAITQPALSERVKRIEATLDTSLFERGKRGVKITPTGELILIEARDLLDRASAIDEIASATQAPLSGTLRVGAIATLGPYLFPKLLPVLRQQYPKLELVLTEGLTDVLLERLLAGSLDVILAAAPLVDSGIVQKELFREAFQLAVPIGHPFASLKKVSPAQLSGSDMVLLEDGHCLSGQALSVCPAKQGHQRDRLHSMSLETLRHMVAAGAGYTLLPALTVGKSPALTDLISYVDLEQSPGTGRTIVLAYRSTFGRVEDMRLLAQQITRTMLAEPGISTP